MGRTLRELRTEFDRSDQQTKRAIGEYLYNRPGRWVSRQELVATFSVDGSQVSRHLSDLEDTAFIRRREQDGHTEVQWQGVGAGGVGYWIRSITPAPFVAVAQELRPVFTVERLGGVILPAALSVVLLVGGLLLGLAVIVVSYLPGGAVFGVTVFDLVFTAGILTVGVSLTLALAVPAAALELLLDRVVEHFR